MKRQRVRVGRRPRLTLEVAIALIDSLRRGASLEAASRAAGVDVGTVRRWLRKGRRGVRPYKELAQIVDPIRERRKKPLRGFCKRTG